MSGYHDITIYLKPKQVKSLEKKRTFQLTNGDLTSKSGEAFTLRVSKKLYTKFNNALKNNKGIRISAEFHHEGGGIFDVIKNVGKKVIQVVPKPIAKAVVKAGLSGLAGMTGNPALIPLANQIGDSGTDALYATQGKGMIKINDGNKLNPKFHQGQGILDLLFGSGMLKADTKHGKGILDILFGSGLNVHQGRGLFDILFGSGYKEGKGYFDKLKKIGQIATKIIPKEVVQGLANQAIEKVLPSELQGIAKAGTQLGVNQGYQSMGNGLKKLNLKRQSNNDSNIQFLHTKGDLLNGIQLQSGIKKIRRGGSFLPL